jgi:hypothetical protein
MFMKTPDGRDARRLQARTPALHDGIALAVQITVTRRIFDG